jgi:hypothetical protein
VSEFRKRFLRHLSVIVAVGDDKARQRDFAFGCRFFLERRFSGGAQYVEFVHLMLASIAQAR